MPPLRAGLSLLLLLSAAGAAAQDTRTMVIETLRAEGCTMGDAEAEAEFGGMGLDRTEVGNVFQEMIAAGEAFLSGDGARVTLSPELCGPAGTPAAGTMAAAWIERRLRTAEGCRESLATLAAEAEAEGFAPEAFDRGLLNLAEGGVVVPERSDVMHTSCEAGLLPAADPLARVEAYGIPGFRGLVALHAMQNGCRFPQAARAATVQAIAMEAALRVGLAEPVPPEAMTAIRERIEEVLDNPGRVYEIDPTTGDLVMIHCTP